MNIKEVYNLDKQKIGRKKNLAFYYMRRDNLSIKKYNVALEVYMLDKQSLELVFVGGKYNIHSSAWTGERATALKIIKRIFTDLKASTYDLLDKRVKVLQAL